MTTTALAHPALEAMTAAEARDCADRIRGCLAQARGLIVDLYRREGWRALGYESWRECVTAEFEQSKTHLYRQLQAGIIEERISPIGEIGVIPESHLRPLGRLAPELQAAAWECAGETAPNGKVTAAHVEATTLRMITAVMAEEADPLRVPAPETAQPAASEAVKPDPNHPYMKVNEIIGHLEALADPPLTAAEFREITTQQLVSWGRTKAQALVPTVQAFLLGLTRSES